MKQLVLAVALGASAWAGTLEDVVQAHKTGTLVYVAPGMTVPYAERLRALIDKTGAPVVVAFLPASAATEYSADEWPLKIAGQFSIPLGVGVLVGNSWRANATQTVGLMPAPVVATLATSAFTMHRKDGPEAVITNWIERMREAVPSPKAAEILQRVAVDPLVTPKQEDPWAWSWWTFFGWVGLGGFFGWAIRRFQRRRRKVAQAAAVQSRLQSVKKKETQREQRTQQEAKAAGKVRINGINRAYSPSETVVHKHYYGGGYYDGRYVPTGYYDDPFWRYMAMSTILNDRRDQPAPAVVPPPAPAPEPGKVVPTKPYESVIPVEPREANVSWGSGGGDFSSHSGGGDFSSSSRGSGGGDLGGGGGGDGGDGGGGSSGGGDF